MTTEDLADEIAGHHAVTVRGREGYEAVKARLDRARAEGAAAERERIIALADSVKAVATADEGTQCYFADMLRQERDETQ